MVAATINPARDRSGYFYVWMAGVCALIAFGGFAPTYWLQLAPRTFIGPPLLHIHGALFSAWSLLLLSQTWLAANDRLDHHRAWGLAGIALASAMVVVGITAAILSLKVGLAAGYGDKSRGFLLVPVTAIGLFAGFFIAAVANINRAEWHKRLICWPPCRCCRPRWRGCSSRSSPAAAPARGRVSARRRRWPSPWSPACCST